MKTLYEKLGATYRDENEYLIPDVELPAQKPIGTRDRRKRDNLYMNEDAA